MSSSDEPELPRLGDDGDEIEITLVMTSPATDSSDAPEISIEHESAAHPAEGSSVKVQYEDEAEEEEVTSPIARILIHAMAETDQGKVRRRNEDNLLVFPERSLFAVADGMGGYRGGALASALAVETLRDVFEREAFDAKAESETYVPRRGLELARAMQMANQAILAIAEGDSSLTNMGTTVVAARFSPNKRRVYIGHVGDSRCYRLRGSTLRQLTTDHTMAELGMRGPKAKQLYQAVGIQTNMKIDLIVDKPRCDDVYLLCSDGLTKMVSDTGIHEILSRELDLEAAVYTLLEAAIDRGGKDNVTIILVKVLERPQPLLMP
jgi:protein phosphatase